MEPNRLEQEFKNKLEQRTIEPSKMAWDRLDAMLSVGEEKKEKRPNRSWMYMAASFVLFATVGAYFLTQEKQNGGNGTESNGTSVVNTEKQVHPEETNDTVQPATIQPATDNLSAPKMQENAVAITHTTKAALTGRGTSSQNTAAGRDIKANNNTIIMPPANNEGVATVTHEGLKEDAVKDFEADKLLASAGNTSKKKPSIKVDANSLLSSVEGELDDNFRDKALQGAIKSFNAVKSSVANRNYQ